MSSCVENVDCNTLTDHFVECKHEHSAMVNANLVHDNSEMLRENNVINNLSVEHRNINTVDENIVRSSKPTFICAGESKISYKSPQVQKQQFHPSVNLETDKYELDLRFRPCDRNQIAAASDNSTFTSWNDQTKDKFGFIPLGDLTLPPIDLKNQSKEKIFDIHRRIKVSGTHNFMQSQI